jgi:hypothetical protein
VTGPRNYLLRLVVADVAAYERFSADQAAMPPA